jgi:hypothetical protein
MKSTAFEDSNGALGLATSPKMTPRTRHIAVKYHFFKEHIKPGEIEIIKIDTKVSKGGYPHERPYCGRLRDDSTSPDGMVSRHLDRKEV